MLQLICAIVGEAHRLFSVRVDDDNLVDDLKDAIKAKNEDIKVPARNMQLFLAKTTSGEWLQGDDPAVLGLGTRPIHQDVTKTLEGEEMNPTHTLQHWLFDRNKMPQPSTGQLHVLVVLPKEEVVPKEVAEAALSMLNVRAPATSELNEPDKFAQECISLLDWDVSTEQANTQSDNQAPILHNIPLIWKFMEKLGGCTTTGSIFWRAQEKKIVALLVDRSFRESSPNNVNPRAGMRSILIGSPGIGKSTLLCVVAFNVVFEHKKNVLVYRNLGDMYSLFYLGYEKRDNEDKVVHFSVPQCEEPHAISIYKQLQSTLDVWLLLDGFRFQEIPIGLRTFAVLATSQQVRPKGVEEDKYYVCLLPCWSKVDLLLMGEHIYEFGREEMERRFFYSGGNVRWFTVANVEEIRVPVINAISRVKDVSDLLSNRSSVLSGNSQVDHLRRTFWKDPEQSCIDPNNWEQVVDSEFALSKLSIRIRTDTLSQYYEWARSHGNGSLAGLVFEIYLHRLATDNRLILQTSEYEVNPQRRSRRHFVSKQVKLKKGKTMCSGEKGNYADDLMKWKNDENYAYWFPASYNLPNIDGIAKLESGKVAYLQFTIAPRHGIDSNQLIEMDAILNSTRHAKQPRPIYIAVCQNDVKCRNFVLDPQSEATEAKKVRRVYVGYYTEDSSRTAADDPDEPLIEELQYIEYNNRKRPRIEASYCDRLPKS